MRILFRYVLREVLVTALIGAFVFTFVLFLPRIGGVMELLVRPGAASGDILHLFLLMVPQLFRFSIPMGVLVGVLVGLGRLSSDREITAMRAAGIPGGRCVLPVGFLAVVAGAVCAATTLYFNPIAQREFHAIAETLNISQATAEVPPRVFIEDFPNRVLYVRDVVSGPVVHWKGVFLADMRSPEERGSPMSGSGAVDGPRITVAPEAVVVPRPEQDRLQLTLPTATVFEESFDPTQYHTGSYEQGDSVLETRPADLSARARPFEWMDMPTLIEAARSGDDRVTAGIELHQRFGLPAGLPDSAVGRYPAFDFDAARRQECGHRIQPGAVVRLLDDHDRRRGHGQGAHPAGVAGDLDGQPALCGRRPVHAVATGRTQPSAIWWP